MTVSRMYRTRRLKAFLLSLLQVAIGAIVVSFVTASAVAVYTTAELDWLLHDEPDTSGVPTYVIQVERKAEAHE